MALEGPGSGAPSAALSAGGGPAPGASASPAPAQRRELPSFYRVRPTAEGSPLAQWLVAGGVFVAGLAFGVLGTRLLWRSSASAVVSPPVTAVAAPSGSAGAVKSPARAAPTRLEKVAAGDAAAIRELESRPMEERSAEEALALAKGRYAAKRAEIAKLGETLATSPDLAQDPQLLVRLRREAKDPDLAEEVLGIVTRLPGSGGPDVLYDVWYKSRKGSPLAQLAEELLFSRDMRVKASPALSVVLELRVEQDCERVQQIVARAAEHGDLRALIPLGRLVPKVGCGETKTQDCYPCLGNRAAVRDAISAVRRRPMPAL